MNLIKHDDRTVSFICDGCNAHCDHVGIVITLNKKTKAVNVCGKCLSSNHPILKGNVETYGDVSIKVGPNGSINIGSEQENKKENDEHDRSC